MEILPLDLSSILLLAAAGLLLYMYITWPSSYLRKLGVPGPRPMPFIGIFIDLILSSKSLTDIDEDLIKKYGNVVGTFEIGTASLLIAEPKLIKQVLVKDFQHFMDRAYMPLRGALRHSVFDKRGEDWKRIRSLSSPFFSSGKLRQNAKRINSVLNDITEYFHEQSKNRTEMEAKSVTSFLTMDVICNLVFGVETKTLSNPDHPLAVCSKKVVRGASPQNPWFMFLLFFPGLATFLENVMEISMFDRKSVSYLTDVCRTLIRKKADGDKAAEEFVTALLKAHEVALEYETTHKEFPREHKPTNYKGMNDDEIIAQALVFLLAGYDTTSNTLAFLIHSLIMNPDVQDQLYQEIMEHIGNEDPNYDNVQRVDYLDWCMDETLRIYGPAPRITRVVTADEIKVGGIPLKRGMAVAIPIWYLHHNPDIWPDPYKFDPMRFSPEQKKSRDSYYFIPFGTGPRQCIGQRLAELEIKMAIVKILQNFKFVSNTKTVQVEFVKRALFTTAKDGLWFSVTERN